VVRGLEVVRPDAGLVVAIIVELDLLPANALRDLALDLLTLRASLLVLNRNGLRHPLGDNVFP
jgi:hypothetical protein